jgi:hypothetical protein
MTEAEAKRVIEDAFIAGWRDAAPDVPFSIENEGAPSGDVFALLTITMTTGQQLTMGEPGAREVSRNGWIVVKLWGPINEGTTRLDALSEVVRGIFEMKFLTGPGIEAIDTDVTSTQPGGTDGRWFMQLARTPFTVYETK